MSSDSLRRYLRFVTVGFLATLMHVAVYAGQVEMLGVHPVAATFPAFVTAMLVSYAANHAWTFRARGEHRQYLPRFAAVAVTGLMLNISITALLIEVAGLWYGWALAVCVSVVPIVTFALNQRWVFFGVHKA